MAPRSDCSASMLCGATRYVVLDSSVCTRAAESSCAMGFGVRRPIGRKGGQAGAWPKERQLAPRRRFGATFWMRCPRYPPTEKDVDMSPIRLDQDAVARCALDRLIRIPIGAGLCDPCTQVAVQEGLVQRACDWSATRPGIRRDRAWTGLPVPGTLFRPFLLPARTLPPLA